MYDDYQYPKGFLLRKMRELTQPTPEEDERLRQQFRDYGKQLESEIREIVARPLPEASPAS